MQYTNFLEAAVLDHIFRAQAYTPPGGLWLALFTDDTDDDGFATEAVGGSYLPQPITFPEATTGSAANSGALTFANLPGGTVTHGAITDSATPGAGNRYLHGALSTPRTVEAGGDLVIGAGEIVVGNTAGSAATTYLRNLIINRMLRGDAYVPGDVYVGLYESATDVSGGGIEIAGGSYARQIATIGPATSEVSTADALEFTDLPDQTVDPISHAAILDALTVGNMLVQAALAEPYAASAGARAGFPAGGLRLAIR